VEVDSDQGKRGVSSASRRGVARASALAEGRRAREVREETCSAARLAVLVLGATALRRWNRPLRLGAAGLAVRPRVSPSFIASGHGRFRGGHRVVPSIAHAAVLVTLYSAASYEISVSSRLEWLSRWLVLVVYDGHS
jgi:hypothetical protein